MEIEIQPPAKHATLRASWIPSIRRSGRFLCTTHIQLCRVLDAEYRHPRFAGNTFIVGATAAALGDRFTSPFVHIEGPDGQHMENSVPDRGLANSLTRSWGRCIRKTPDWLSAVCAALVALLNALWTFHRTGQSRKLKQLAMIVLIGVSILALSYFAFLHWLVITHR